MRHPQCHPISIKKNMTFQQGTKKYSMSFLRRGRSGFSRVLSPNLHYYAGNTLNFCRFFNLK